MTTLITYELNTIHNRIKSEEFKKNTQTLLKRQENGKGQIFANEIGQNIQFGLGESHLAFSTKRDSVQHPFLENLARWAENVRYYKFGEDMGRTHLEIRSDENNDGIEIDRPTTETSCFFIL